MPRRPPLLAPASAPDPDAGAPADGGVPGSMTTSAPGAGLPRDLPDLSSLGIAGLTRRRTAGILGVVLAGWIVVVFARQVGDASAASARAEQLGRDNAVLAVDVERLERELQLIGRQSYVEQQARAYGMGNRKEIPFALEGGAPPLPDDAPGSASVRLGAASLDVSPLERWMTLLFGPGD